MTTNGGEAPPSVTPSTPPRREEPILASHSGPPPATDDQLEPGTLREVLRRVAALEEKPSDQEARWHTRLGTVAGIAGLALSLVLGAHTVYQETVSEDWQRRQQLTEVVAKLTELNLRGIELAARLNASGTAASTDGMNDAREALRPLANQRFILLNQAKRIVDALDGPAPTLELSVLADSYVSQLDYDSAEKYLTAVAKHADPALAASGYRSLGVLAFMKGPRFHADGRAAFRSAAALLDSRSDVASVGFLLDVYQVWAQYELAFDNPQGAAERAIDARTACRRMPCIPLRATCSRWSKETIASILGARPDLAAAVESYVGVPAQVDPRAIACPDPFG